MVGRDPETLSREYILREIAGLRVAYALKCTLRYATSRDRTVHSESVAEHVFALIFLANYFLELEDPDGTMNREEIITILLFHDFPEIKYGDICFHLKTKELEDRENDAAAEIFGSLPVSLRNKAHAAWLAYEQRSSKEARFAYALDKIEPIFEMLDEVNQKSFVRLKVDYETYWRKKYEATLEFPFMARFLEVITEEFLARDVFWKPKAVIAAE